VLNLDTARLAREHNDSKRGFRWASEMIPEELALEM